MKTKSESSKKSPAKEKKEEKVKEAEKPKPKERQEPKPVKKEAKDDAKKGKKKQAVELEKPADFDDGGWQEVPKKEKKKVKLLMFVISTYEKVCNESININQSMYKPFLTIFMQQSVTNDCKLFKLL